MISKKQQILIQDLLQTSDLELFMDSNWGSQNSSHRKFLREFSHSKNFAFSSASHTIGCGAFAGSSSKPIGIDLEVTLRVTEAAVKRISASLERAAAPTAAALWCAKEAAFKALKTFRQPPVISSISIGEWQNIDSHTETFSINNFDEFRAPPEGRGLIMEFAPYTLAFFSFCP